MKIPAKDLKTILRSLSAVSSDSLLFAGREVYAVGQNITVIVGLPVDLGTFGIGTEKFVQIVNKLEGDIDLAAAEKLVIKSGRSRFTLPVTTEIHIPAVQIPHDSVEIPFAGMVEMLDFASQACKNEVFNYTGSVLFTSERAVGTDGNKLMLMDGGAFHCPQILIPFPVIRTLKTFVGGTVRIGEDATNLYFSIGQATIIARKLAKTFPAYESIVPKTFQSKHEIKASDMIQALRRIHPLLDEDKRILLTMNSDSCILTLTSAHGSAEDRLEAEQLEPDPVFEPCEVRFSVDSEALTDFYEEVEGETIFCGNGPANPIWIEAGNKKLLCSSKGA